jgi:hypothetical protein
MTDPSAGNSTVFRDVIHSTVGADMSGYGPNTVSCIRKKESPEWVGTFSMVPRLKVEELDGTLSWLGLRVCFLCDWRNL